MDFLKNAVASAMAAGPPFPYNFGDKVDVDESVFTLYNGTKRASAPSRLLFPAIESVLTNPHRKMVRIVASSPSTLQPRKAACPSREMRSRNCARCDILVSSKSLTPSKLVCSARNQSARGTLLNVSLDRNVHLHCHGACCTPSMAREKKEPRPRDD